MTYSPNILFGADGKLRSGWRFAMFVVSFILLGTIFGAAAMLLASLVFGHPQPGSPIFLTTNGIVSLGIALLVGWLCGKYLENVPFEALGASFKNNWLVNLLMGLAGGAITFAIGAGLGTLFGGLSFSINTETAASSILSTLFISFLVFAAAAAFEEALFRGYMLQTFVRSDLTIFGVLLTSALFASVHNANPSSSIISWTNTFIAGLWFAVAYLKTRDLWFPTGLHLAWNWTQGSIFGVEVSGLTDIVKYPVMRETDLGPAWLTGGDYGIEGGIVTSVALLVSIAVIKFIPFGTASDQSSEFKL